MGSTKKQASRERRGGKSGLPDAELQELAREVWRERNDKREARRRQLEQDPFVQKARVILKNLEIAIEGATDPSAGAHVEAMRPILTRHVRKMVYAELLVQASPGPTKEQRLHVLFQELATTCGAYSENGRANFAGDELHDAARLVTHNYAFAFPDSPLDVEALMPVVASWSDTRAGRKRKGDVGKYDALRAVLQPTPLKRYSASVLATEHRKWRRGRKRNP